MKNIIYSFMIIFTLMLTGCADAGPDQEVRSGAKVTLDASDSGTDEGGRIVKYLWKQKKTRASLKVTLADNPGKNPTFTAPYVKKTTKLYFRLKTIEYYDCKYRATPPTRKYRGKAYDYTKSQLCKINTSTDNVRITVAPGNGTNTGGDTNDTTGLTLSGHIVDTEGKAISAAKVKVDTQTTTSDSNGSYSVKNVGSDKRVRINVSHPDYLSNSRIIDTGKNSVAQDVILNKPQIKLTYAALRGASLNHGTASVTLPAGTYVYDDGTTYDGNITAKMSYHTIKNNKELFPGRFEGKRNDKAFPLQSYGFMKIELSDDADVPLNLTNGDTATLTFPKDNALTASDATVPLWYYNESTGYWKEEGETTQQGNTYTGTVAHFTAWGLAVKGTQATLTTCVEDEDGLGISSAEVALTNSHWDAPVRQTDVNGSVTIDNVLAEEPLTLQASATVKGKYLTKSYHNTIELVEDDKKNLADCIVLKEETIVEDTNSTENNNTDNNDTDIESTDSNNSENNSSDNNMTL